MTLIWDRGHNKRGCLHDQDTTAPADGLKSAERTSAWSREHSQGSSTQKPATSGGEAEEGTAAGQGDGGREEDLNGPTACRREGSKDRRSRGVGGPIFMMIGDGGEITSSSPESKASVTGEPVWFPGEVPLWQPSRPPLVRTGELGREAASWE